MGQDIEEMMNNLNITVLGNGFVAMTDVHIHGVADVEASSGSVNIELSHAARVEAVSEPSEGVPLRYDLRFGDGGSAQDVGSDHVRPRPAATRREALAVGDAVCVEFRGPRGGIYNAHVAAGHRGGESYTLDWANGELTQRVQPAQSVRRRKRGRRRRRLRLRKGKKMDRYIE